MRSGPPPCDSRGNVPHQTDNNLRFPQFLPVSPLLATHPKNQLCNSFRCHTCKNKGLKVLYLPYIQNRGVFFFWYQALTESISARKLCLPRLDLIRIRRGRCGNPWQLPLVACGNLQPAIATAALRCPSGFPPTRRTPALPPQPSLPIPA